jgi:hypothetical protein
VGWWGWDLKGEDGVRAKVLTLVFEYLT